MTPETSAGVVLVGLDKVAEEVKLYEQAIPGGVGGEDYPMFVANIVSTDNFKSLVQRAVMTGVIETLTMKKPPESAESESQKWMESLCASTTFRDFTAKCLYLGYRLAKLEQRGDGQ